MLKTQTVTSHKMFAAIEFQSFADSGRSTPPPTPQNSSLSLQNSLAEEDGLAVTPEGEDGRQTEQAEGEEMWPEIVAIVGRIRTLEGRLRIEQRTTAELKAKIEQMESGWAAMEEERQRAMTEASACQQSMGQLEGRVRDLEAALAEKQAALTERQQLIEDIQYGQLQRNNESEQRIRKLNTDAKELTDKLRKANLEAEKQRKSHQQLKESMAAQLEQLQSHRDSFLLDELQRLRALIATSQGDRESLLYGQIEALNRRVYLQEQELKRGEIELAVAERKRQQAVADTAEKKDQELKVQKTLSKALSEKVGKLQEEVKTLRTQTPEIRHPRKVLRNCNRTTEEELSFELTPEKK